MNAADKAAGESGINMWRMMVNAGSAIAAAALKHYPGTQRFAVLCGPGNNGGDGYVAAHCLKEAGAVVTVFRFGPAPEQGDAEKASALWNGLIQPIEDYEVLPGDVVIDALFGAGLCRPLPETLCALIATINRAREEDGLAVIAADLPSGIDGRTGSFPTGSAEAACAMRADRTVTFMCLKPGHLLLPGRDYCGVVELVDIGIPERIVLAHDQNLRVNGPDLWLSTLPRGEAGDHKYSKGHLCVFGGAANATGASRLAAQSALRSGAGAVTLLAPREALEINTAHLTAVMLKEASEEVVEAALQDPRVTGFVIGPGYGVGEAARQMVLRIASKPLVLDADAISSFAGHAEMLADRLGGRDTAFIMTPHEGEFSRLFPDLTSDNTLSKIDRARLAAKRMNAVIVYKGADTVIASPDGRTCVNCNAPPWLATAGSGDVLAGIAGALLARGVAAFEAAAAAVWLHAEAGNRAGEGLTAESLVEAISPAQVHEE